MEGDPTVSGAAGYLAAITGIIQKSHLPAVSSLLSLSRRCSCRWSDADRATDLQHSCAHGKYYFCPVSDARQITASDGYMESSTLISIHRLCLLGCVTCCTIPGCTGEYASGRDLLTIVAQVDAHYGFCCFSRAVFRFGVNGDALNCCSTYTFRLLPLVW